MKNIISKSSFWLKPSDSYADHRLESKEFFLLQLQHSRRLLQVYLYDLWYEFHNISCFESPLAFRVIPQESLIPSGD